MSYTTTPMLLNPFLLAITALSKPTIINQTMFRSTVIYTTEQWVTAPPHCLILGAKISAHPLYYGSRFELIKPLRKMHEYENDIERGVLIGGVRDVSNYPDFSSQILGMAMPGLLVSVMFKLFG